MRKEAKVTGSTLHRAIGLGTLKEAQAHFESVYNGVETPEPSHNKKNAVKHARDNEINAVATLVVKFHLFITQQLYLWKRAAIKFYMLTIKM